MVSGVPICHPSAKTGAFGRSAGLPSGAPLLAHFTMVSRSLSLKRRSLRNWPCDGSACHGGIVPSVTRVAIAFAHGRASANDTSGIGPISPARWQFVQFLYRIGATSLLNVGAGDCAYTDAAAPIKPATAMATRVRVISSSCWLTGLGNRRIVPLSSYVVQPAEVSKKRGISRYFLRPPVFRLRAPPFRLRGTLPPALRASLRPMAMACFRLVTFLPDRPDFSVPRLRSCIARLTLLCAFLPYFAIHSSLLPPSTFYLLTSNF